MKQEDITIHKNCSFEAEYVLWGDDDRRIELPNHKAEFIIKEQNDDTLPILFTPQTVSIVDNKIIVKIGQDQTKGLKSNGGYYNVILNNLDENTRVKIIEGHISFKESL